MSRRRQWSESELAHRESSVGIDPLAYGTLAAGQPARAAVVARLKAVAGVCITLDLVFVIAAAAIYPKANEHAAGVFVHEWVLLIAIVLSAPGAALIVGLFLKQAWRAAYWLATGEEARCR